MENERNAMFNQIPKQVARLSGSGAPVKPPTAGPAKSCMDPLGRGALPRAGPEGAGCHDGGRTLLELQGHALGAGEHLRARAGDRGDKGLTNADQEVVLGPPPPEHFATCSEMFRNVLRGAGMVECLGAQKPFKFFISPLSFLIFSLISLMSLLIVH